MLARQAIYLHVYGEEIENALKGIEGMTPDEVREQRLRLGCDYPGGTGPGHGRQPFLYQPLEIRPTLHVGCAVKFLQFQYQPCVPAKS
jgi:hypothetical protein